MKHILLGLMLVVFSMSVHAFDNETHGAGIGKGCPTVTKVGDQAMCSLTVTNSDDFGDNLRVFEMYDMVGLDVRVPTIGNLPIVEVKGALCVSVPVSNAAPIGLDFPCVISGLPIGSRNYVTTLAVYTVPVGSTNPLFDVGTTIVQDVCNVQPGGCSDGLQQLQFGGAVSLFNPAIEAVDVSAKVAKVGDEINYSIGFIDVSTGTQPPGFENCTGTDTLLGDLGAFEAGVPRDFSYTTKTGDPTPLTNKTTITCKVVGFNNIVYSSTDNSVTLISPEIEVITNATPVAKVGDEINYAISFNSIGTGVLENCTGTDTFLGYLGVFEDGVTRNFPWTIQPNDPNPLTSVTTITCNVVGFDNKVDSSAPNSVKLISPEIVVLIDSTKVTKVGDEINYTIGFNSIGTGRVLGVCTGKDTLLGDLGVFESGVPRNFPYTTSSSDASPLTSKTVITCNVVGFENIVSAIETSTVKFILPKIEIFTDVTNAAKVGDEINYEIGFIDNSIGTQPICTGKDTLLGDLGAFVDGVTRNFPYTIKPTDPNPLTSVTTITCNVVGFDNEVSSGTDNSVKLITPNVELTNTCRPDPVYVGDLLEWVITVKNTGDTNIHCLLDSTSGFIDEPVTLAPGDSDTLLSDQTARVNDVPAIFNTATISCPILGFDNMLEDSVTSVCEVKERETYDEICRSPGFWGSHAGVEKRKSTNLTQLVIDAAGGTLVVCGKDVTNTLVPDEESAVEAICVSPKGDKRLQLVRQLTAASLNCVISGGGTDCSGSSIEAEWTDANAACIANDKNLSKWIGPMDDFNNSELCHERDLGDSPVFANMDKLPGPAGSPKACNKATGNLTTVFGIR